MNKKNYVKNFVLCSCLNFWACFGQESVDVNLNDLPAEKQLAKSDSALVGDVHKFIIEAKRDGILDEELAKVLIAYTLLNKTSIDEIQKFITAVEFAGVSRTRSVSSESKELSEALVAKTRSEALIRELIVSNKESKNDQFWGRAASVLLIIIVVCAFIYYLDYTYNNRGWNKVKRGFGNFMDWSEDVLYDIQRSWTRAQRERQQQA